MATLKQFKSITPLESAHYPLRTMDDASPLLKERLVQLERTLCAVYNLKTAPSIWLYGSQVKGKSFSKQPDIDVYFYHADLEGKSGQWIYERIGAVRNELDFRLDLSFGNYTGMEHSPNFSGVFLKIN